MTAPPTNRIWRAGGAFAVATMPVAMLFNSAYHQRGGFSPKAVPWQQMHAADVIVMLVLSLTPAALYALPGQIPLRRPSAAIFAAFSSPYLVVEVTHETFVDGGALTEVDPVFSLMMIACLGFGILAVACLLQNLKRSSVI